MLWLPTRRPNRRARVWLALTVALASHTWGSRAATPPQAPKLRLNRGESLGALSPDFRIVATTQFIPQGKGDNPPGYGIVRLRDTQTGQVQRKLIVPDLSEADPVFEYGYTSLLFSPDGKTLACMADTQRGLQVSLWEVQTGRLRRKLAVPEYPGMEADVFIAFSPDSQLLATVGDSDIPGKDDVRLVIRVWDLRTGTLKRKLWRGVKGLQVAFSPDGKRLAVANNLFEDHSVRLWDIASGRVVQTLSGHQREAKSLAFSPDGKLLATASEDHSVRVWDLATGRTRRTLAGAYDLVFFLPDGRGLVTAGGPHGEARLWNLKTGQQERSLSFQECTRVNAVSRDGKKVADLDSGDGTLQIERLW